MIILYSKSSEY